MENAGTVEAAFYVAETRQEWDDPSRGRGGPVDAPQQVVVEECDDSRKAKFTTKYGEPEYQPPPSFRGKLASPLAARLSRRGVH